MSGQPAPRPKRLAAAWFLGACFVALFVFAWLRGAGRVMLPVLVAIAVAAILVRVIRAVLRPLP